MPASIATVVAGGGCLRVLLDNASVESVLRVRGQSPPGECPRIVHHNWFGPRMTAEDRKVLRANLARIACRRASPLRPWQVFFWMSREFNETNAVLAEHSAFLASLAREFRIQVHFVEEDAGATPGDLIMLRKLWHDTQILRNLRATDARYRGKVTWIAAMSDFARMLAVDRFGGIWADVGDTAFPRNFPAVWRRHGLHILPCGFRVAFNHSGIVRSPSQHLFAALPASEITRRCLARMRQLWRERVAAIDVRDPATDLIGTTLAWTGMGGTTGPIMKAIQVTLATGEITSMMNAWKRGWCGVRMGAPSKAKPEFCVLGRWEKDAIKTWSNKSWFFY